MGKMNQQDERRLAENEVLFKAINKEVEGFMHDLGTQHLVLVPFFCECSDMKCRERIELSAAEYERIHQTPKRFIVLNGHERPAIERVVARHDTYSVVEKLVDLPEISEVEHRLKEF